MRDDQNHETTVGYDNLGRRTQLNNLDTGLTETVYDLASNVVQRITANLRAQGKAIKHEYDYKRLIRITYPNFPGNNVSYTYGGPSEPFNRAGRIITVADQSGQEERFYGPLGEVVKSIKTIASDTGKQPEVYTTEYEYDTWNRLQKLIYPDAEVLTNQYDSGGLLQSVVGDKAGNHYKYVNRLEYDKFEQRALLEFGNGVRTNYQYATNNRRLTNLQAGKAGKLFQDLTYQYDLVGNILGQANLAKVTSPSQMGGATQYQYQYDDLYRLVHAEGTFDEARKSHRYQLEMGYDTVHNILSKKQLAEVGEPSGIWLENKKVSYDWQYAYSGPQPHAPTHIGERTFNYDANGNQIGWSHDANGTRRNIVWDEENRIQTILAEGQALTYKYDAAGTRVLKRGPQGETAYVNQFFVIRNGAVATKQVYAGSSRVVSKLVKQESAMDKVAKTRRGERKNDGTPGNAGGSSCDNPGQGQSPHCSPTTPPAPVTPPVTPPVDPPVTGGEGTAAPVTPTPSTPVSSGGVTPTPPSTPVTPTPSSPDNGTVSPPPTSSSPSTGNGNVNASSGQTSSGNNNGGQPNTSTTPNTQPTTADGKVKGPEEKDLYFYHPDHLGSTHYVTDAKGELYQHAEYFAFGESWVEQASSQRVAFGFTGKEFDAETGLYYFGARYYDARTSVWVSPDPILGAYLPTGDKEKDGQLPGMGGVFNSFNLGLYSYGHLNPVKFMDPDGNQTSGGDDDPNKTYYVINNSSKRVACLLESDGGDWKNGKIVIVEPGKKLEQPIDGIRVEGWKDDWVYKVGDGVSVTIDENVIVNKDYSSSLRTSVKEKLVGNGGKWPGTNYGLLKVSDRKNGLNGSNGDFKWVNLRNSFSKTQLTFEIEYIGDKYGTTVPIGKEKLR